MNPAWRWSDLPQWLETEIEKDREALTREQPPEKTLELRVRIKAYRAILKLPEVDPHRGKIQRVDV